MIKVALKGLAGRKLRASLSAFAIILGVAMVSGTFVLTDTMNGAFDSIITQSYKNADVVISGKTAFDTDSNGNTVQPPSFPESVLAKIKALPDVNAAAGSLTDDKTKLVGRDGKVVATGGAPNLAFSVDPGSDQRFNPLEVTAGTWPEGPNQVAIDTGTASKKHYAVGDTIGVQSRGPVLESKRCRRASLDAGQDARRIRGADTAQARPAQFRQPRHRFLDRFDRAEAVSPRRQAGRHSRPGEERRHDAEAARRDQAAPTCGRSGHRCGCTGEEGQEEPELHLLHQVLPACFRRNRALRRELRDRKHAFDHHRAAGA